MTTDYTMIKEGALHQANGGYLVVQALYEDPEGLRITGPLWKEFTAEGMSKDVGLEYHPGAIRFYQEMGIWRDSM